MVKVNWRQLIAAGVLGVLAGCSNPAANDTSGTTTGGTVATNTTTTAPALNLPEPPLPKEAIPSEAAKKPYHIGVSLLTQDDDFYRSLKQGLTDEGAKQNVKLDILSADKDLAKQVNQIEDFIAQKVDAIIVSPVDSSSIVGVVDNANKQGIPVFTADIASKGGKIVTHVASDNVEGGRLAGEYAAKLLSGKGNVAILDQKEVSSVQDRVNGFKESIAKFPDIKIVADQNVTGGKRENAIPVATDLLTAHPEINLIFGINDNVALGALSALQQANNKTVTVIGFDAAPEAQTNIASGASPLKGDAIQFPHLIGVTTVNAVVRSLNGETVPPKIAVPTGMVTPDSFKK